MYNDGGDVEALSLEHLKTQGIERYMTVLIA